MLDETGCAGVSIGRGAFYNPWIFTHTRHYLKTGELRPEPGYAERVTVMRRHLDLMIKVFGEDYGCRLFRKPAAWYAKRFGPAKEFKRGITQFSTRAEFEALLVNYEKWRAPFLDAAGELKAQYQPEAMVASFMRDEDLPAPRPGTFFVYVLECADGSHYIGQTDDLERRWSEHVAGHGAEWTKRHPPRKVIQWEQFDSREAVVAREQELKTGFGREWLKREIAAGRTRQAGEPAALRRTSIPVPKGPVDVW